MPTGTSGWRARKAREQGEAVGRPVRPRASARPAAAWITGPSATGSEKGMPTSSMSAPPSTSASRIAALVSRSGSPSMTKAPNAPSPRAASAREHRRVAAHAASSSRRCACSMSLSPRPERLTTSTISVAASASFSAWAERMGGFEGADDPLRAGQQREGVERLGVGRADIVGPAAVLQVGMFRPDRRIIEPGRDRPAVGDLPVLVLQHIGLGAVQDAGPAAQQGRAMLARRRAPARPPRRRSAGRPRRR